jgi:hypothetical protein
MRLNHFALAASTASALAGVPAAAQEARPNIPGYTYGSPELKRSPVTPAELAKIEEALLFTDEDVRYLREAGQIMVPQTEQILDVWYGFVGSHPDLAYYFANKKTGELDKDYLTRVRGRFGQWIKDTTDANYDQRWLDYQYEIGLRHTKSGKNRTDKAPSVDQVNFRYMPAFIVPITATVEPFLAKGGKSPEEVRKMMAAWNKAVTLQVILWSYPYIKDGQF